MTDEMDKCEICANADNEYCFACDNGNQFKPLTNGDKLRAMTDEELAKFITELLYPVSNNYSYDIWVKGLRLGTLKWLKSGVETK